MRTQPMSPSALDARHDCGDAKVTLARQVAHKLAKVAIIARLLGNIFDPHHLAGIPISHRIHPFEQDFEMLGDLGG
jgi:hypothetical protein